MKIFSNKNEKISFLLYITAVILLAAVLWELDKLLQDTPDGFPVVQIVIEQNEQRDLQINGHIAGADFIYTGYDGQTERHYIPSLQGIWQLDEPYAQSTVLLPSEADYFSLYCARNRDGGFGNRPHSIYAVRFDQTVVSTTPGESPDWSDGIEVALEKHGKLYRIQNPTANSVYVVRSVWDSGVFEHAWWIVAE